MSSLWWSGFERLGQAHSLHAQRRAMTALILLPQLYLDSVPVTTRRREQWRAELNVSTVRATNRVLSAMPPHPLVVTRDYALAYHVAVHGAGYARDAAMVGAVLPGVETTSLQHFGSAYGLLMGLAADRASSLPPLLLLAHAFAGTGADRDKLARLRRESTTSPAARVALNELAHSRFAVRTYNEDVESLRCRVLGMLADVMKPGVFRAVLQEEVQAAAQAASCKDGQTVLSNAG
ncbi:hypothetical protein [Lentzea waywayandensis]|uniref:hypothetical protein n=1 Tax=Lentzea waywayandensis TaxID=84724 RepID=UPI00116092BC|nr:hypothetical protein [Lentzea waywayandensis]